MAEQAVSPMMQQYFEIKKQHPNEILFYRVGDFYEMFYDDALTASRELELTLTGKNCGKEERAPMCGVPFHSYETYMARLVAKGYKVAICEQMEDPALAKGLVKRDIIRIVTPGSVTESSMLVESKNNYYACVYGAAGTYGLCFCDVSTGAFRNTRSRSSKLLASHARTPKTAKGFVSSLVSKISITFPSRRKPARFSTCGKKRSFAERAVLCRLESVIPSRHSVNCA